MGTRDVQNVVLRLQRLERLVDAYGHLLTAAELDRSLPGLVPILATGEVTAAEAGGLLKEILQRGPAHLLVDLEDLDRTARAAKDDGIYAALNRARDAVLHVVRYNAAALLRRLEQGGQTGPTAAALQKEVQTFVQNAARAMPATHDDLDEVFSDDDVIPADPTSAPAAPEAGNGSSSVDGPADSSRGEAAGNGFVTVPQVLDWARDRIEVFNEMLQCWAASERLEPETSPLVRRGQLGAEQCGALYRELLEDGAVRVLDDVARLSTTEGEGGDQARALRGRIVDGAVASVPRLLNILSTGGRLNTDVNGVRGEQEVVLADLATYLARAAELYDVGSPLRARLVYLAGELRAAAGS